VIGPYQQNGRIIICPPFFDLIGHLLKGNGACLWNIQNPRNTQVGNGRVCQLVASYAVDILFEKYNHPIIR